MSSSSELEFRFRIRFEKNKLGLSSEMSFQAWLPIKESESLVIERDNRRIRLWFDEMCVTWATPKHEKDFGLYPSLGAYWIIVDVLILDASDEVLADLTSTLGTVQPSQDAAPHLTALANDIATDVHRVVNELIRFVRTTKGQYWLVPLPDTLRDGRALFHAAAPKYRHKSGPWVECPFPWIPVIPIRVGSSESRTLTPVDWQAAGKYLAGRGQAISAADEFLAAAEWLSWIGQHRSAIAECVAALESELHAFGSSEDGKARYAARQTGRSEELSLAKAIEKIGMTATVRYLIPMLFDEAELPSATINACLGTIETRNATLHNQMRKVSRSWPRIQAVRSLCASLRAAPGTTT